jgi:hypothetical protein
MFLCEGNKIPEIGQPVTTGRGPAEILDRKRKKNRNKIILLHLTTTKNRIKKGSTHSAF